MNHVEKMRIWIDKYNNEFTHRDIILATNTNCPYTVLRSLKKYYDIESIETEVNGKRFRIYKAKEKENVKKPCIR